MKCLICNKDYNSYKGLATHIRQTHKITSKEYYDIYLKKENEDICPVCGKETPFLKLSKGYQRFCCISCSQKAEETRNKVKETFAKNHNGAINTYQIKEIQQKAEKLANSKEALEKKRQTSIKHYGVDNPAKSKEIQKQIQQTNLKKYGSRAYNKNKGKQTMLKIYGYEHALQVPEFKEKQEQTEYNKWITYAKEHNYLFVHELLQKYDTGWYQSSLGKEIVFCIGQQAFIKASDENKIIQYINSTGSKLENELYRFIKSIYNYKIIRKNRSIIKPLELDIYLPDINLAIEFNGTYWHSINAGKSKDYHLTKSILCRNKNIRLIHIYQFEDFDQQKQLLKDFILGTDNYSKNDFNKNNLIKNIPQPEIIYNNDLIVYGAGKLY